MERYNAFPVWCRKTFGRKLYRIPLDAGMTCPNRDGTISAGGCIFCDEGGSGDFSWKYNGEPLDPERIPYIQKGVEPGSYIGYFQAYTGTYAPVERLHFLFESALKDEMLAGISIATRPDCLGEAVLALLKELKEEYPQKFIWVELGLQTMHDETAEFINRGYRTEVFADAVQHLHALGIPVITHVIIGLPKENEKMLYETIAYLNEQKTDGIKLQLLHVLKHTKLSLLYHTGHLDVLSQEEYIHLLTGCIARLDPGIVIHRLTGDGAPDILEAPLWSRHKPAVLNAVNHSLKEQNIVQGCWNGKERHGREEGNID